MTAQQIERLTRLGASFPTGWTAETAQAAIDYHERRARERRAPRPQSSAGMVVGWVECSDEVGSAWCEFYPGGKLFAVLDFDRDHDFGSSVEWDETSRLSRYGVTRTGVRKF